MASKRKTPPKHLKTSKSVERMPARYNDRVENQRLRAERQQSKAKHSQHSSHKNVVETADNTKLFYDKLLPLAQVSHKKNQRFLRVGVIWLFALPVILFIIRNMTSGNKIAFLIAWIIGMFIIASALIIIAYEDEILQKNLDELQEYVPEVEDNQLGKLKIVSAEDLKALAPDSIESIIQDAIAEREEVQRRIAEARSQWQERKAPAAELTEPVEEAPVAVEAEPVEEEPAVVETEPVEEAPAVVEVEAVEEAPAVVETEPVEEAPVGVETEAVEEAPAAVETEPEKKLPEYWDAEEKTDKRAELSGLHLDDLEEKARLPKGTTWMTEDAGNMWRQLNDPTEEHKGGTEDA